MPSDSPTTGLLSHTAPGTKILNTSSGKGYNVRRVSFGIGGAGNIRNVTEATINDFYAAQDGQDRRRSSVVATSSTSRPSPTARLIDGVKSLFGSSPPKV